MTPSHPIDEVSHTVYSFTKLQEKIDSAIAKYRPEAPPRLWNDAVQHFTRSAVTDFVPQTVDEARNYMSIVARLAIWTTDVACEPLERDVVFDGQHIESFITDETVHMPALARQHQRLRLLRIAAELHKFDPVRRAMRRKLGNNERSAYVPYTHQQLVRFRNQGATRSTPQRRHNWMVLLSLGAGCALSSSEIVHLRMDDIELTDECVIVTVRGDRARTVVCRAEWEDDIRKFLNSSLVGGNDFVFLWNGVEHAPGSPDPVRPSVPSPVVTRVIRDSADDLNARFKVERLRCTWIVKHLEEGTNAIPLIQAIGDKGFSTFVRLIPFVREPSDEEYIAMFRGARR